MDKNVVYAKQILEVMSRFKKNDEGPKCIKDLRPSEEMFLVKLDMMDCNDIKVSDIITKFNLAPSTVSTVLRTLEDQEYITRDKSDDSKREVVVNISPKGKHILKNAKEQHLELMSSLIGYIGEDDAQKLIEILSKINLFFEDRKTN